MISLRVTIINPLSATPQNGQTHSNNSSAKMLTNCLSVFHHFVGLTLKRIIFLESVRKSCKRKLTHIWPITPFYSPWKQPKIKDFLVFQEGQKKNIDQIWVNKVSNTLVALLFCKADGIWEGEQRRIRTLSKFYDGGFFCKTS